MLEQGSAPGGRAARLRADGFTWDTGPSLITMPWVLEEAFAAGGLDLHSEVTLRRARPALPDPLGRRGARAGLLLGRRPAAGGDRALLDARDARALDGFLAALQADLRGRAPRRRAAGVPDRAVVRARSCRAMVALGAIAAAAPLRRPPLRHPRVREAFSFHSLFIGGDPFRVPAIYGALVYLQLLDGGWYTDGGVYALVEAMARAARRALRRPRGGDRDRERRPCRGVRLDGGERIAGRRRRVQRRRAAHARAARPPGPRAGGCGPRCPCFLLYLGCDRRVRRAAAPHAARRPRLPRLHPRRDTRGRGLPSTYSTYVHAPARTEAAMARARRRLARGAAAGARTCARGSTGSGARTGCATRSCATWSRPSGCAGSTRRSAWSTG